ncbi:CHAP domain-containing protein [Alkalimarinus sediminis]|uniref:CHAP domain-containing protein n=1 Tax=Alkalimarinus sediminis TaxID=1632866 RepID=A0A9E8HSP8_9ALTE|nr:CHAP domain-containing protein [Alkalimarinus sediminis]UZW75836.1 CHAP domain-containing protein [Alkalimarinus sediminis]
MSKHSQLKRPSPDKDVVTLQHLLSSHGYFSDRISSHGLFDDITHENVELFQLQHIGPNGQPLQVDGIVGKSTWWALENPSGEAQRNHFGITTPNGLTQKRQQIINVVHEEHSKPVFEVPDGSNRSKDIDGYWGKTGVIGQPWCCAFVSWVLKTVLGKYPINGKHHLGVQKMWRAASRLGLETPQPKPGDVFIQLKSGGKGHTGFVIGVSPDNQQIYTAEGNCGNRLKIGKRDINTIQHFIDCLQDQQSLGFERGNLAVNDVSVDTTR